MLSKGARLSSFRISLTLSWVLQEIIQLFFEIIQSTEGLDLLTDRKSPRQQRALINQLECSAQGCRKSSFWRALGGPFFSDSLRDVTSKDDLMCLHRSWVMEFSELDSLTSKRHAGQIKAFLSQQQDMFRVPYGKAIESFPRRGIVVGSTNRETGFLQDETGNRRFWIIKTTKTPTDPIDVDGLLRERDNIWCSVMDAVKNEETSV